VKDLRSPPERNYMHGHELRATLNGLSFDLDFWPTTRIRVTVRVRVTVRIRLRLPDSIGHI